jgi:signal transduction histidine kinase
LDIAYLLTESGGTLITRIEDTGLGMDDEELAQAFELFSQTNSSIYRRRRGEG